MAKPTRRRRKSRRGAWRWRLLLYGLLLAAGALGALRALVSERTQALLVTYGITEAFLPGLSARLDRSLQREFIAMGLLRSELHEQTAAADADEPVRSYRFTAPPHLTPTWCNLHLKLAAERVGARVLYGEENPKRGGRVVVHLGFGNHLTHRVRIDPRPRVRKPPEDQRPRIALVIDDLGHNMGPPTRGLFELGIPLTVTVLPDLPKSGAAFEAAARHGVPALLHLPMEPDGGGDPGKDPVRVGMTAAAIDDLIERHYKHYGRFVGVSNHMGSRATADPATMRAVVRALERRGLFFFDSLTSERSVGYATARRLGVWSARNDLFLDDQALPAEAVAEQLRTLADIAAKTGLAIGIGHPHPETLEALQGMVPRLVAEGFRFVTLEDLRAEALGAARTPGHGSPRRDTRRTAG